MWADDLAFLADKLTRLRQCLEADAPFGPAWVAHMDYLQELRARARELGRDPDKLHGIRWPADEPAHSSWT